MISITSGVVVLLVVGAVDDLRDLPFATHSHAKGARRAHHSRIGGAADGGEDILGIAHIVNPSSDLPLLVAGRIARGQVDQSITRLHLANTICRLEELLADVGI